MPSLLGAGIFALAVRHANAGYTESQGYVVQDPGGDIPDLPAEEIDLDEARGKCDQYDACLAISYSPSSGTPKVYYKSSADNIYNDCWTSYSKDRQYQEVPGFLPQGADDLLEQTGQKQQAQQACQQDSKCKGFSVRAGTNTFYLKKRWSNPHDDCWTTLVKTDDGVDQEEGGHYYHHGGEGEDSADGGDQEAGGDSAEAPGYYAGAAEAPAAGGDSSTPPGYYGGGAAAAPAPAPTHSYYGSAAPASATYYGR